MSQEKDLHPGKYYQVKIDSDQSPITMTSTVIEFLFYSEPRPGYVAVYNYESACGHLVHLSGIQYAEELPATEVRRRYPRTILDVDPGQRIMDWQRKQAATRCP